MDGEALAMVHVHSGIPQGTILSYLMFWLFISDISDNIQSSIKVFANDCLPFHNISSTEVTIKLDKNFNNLRGWCHCWQMKFNTKKSYTMRIHRRKHAVIHNSTMKK